MPRVDSAILLYDLVDYPPLGALYIASALEQERVAVTLLSIEEPHLYDRIVEGRPDLVLFSATTSARLGKVAEAAAFCREEQGLFCVWGGIHPTLLADQVIADQLADCCVRGDGEEAVRRIVALRRAGDSVPPIIDGGTLPNLDSFLPAWHLWPLASGLRSETHSVRGIVGRRQSIFYYLVTSRGCPFRCAFCYNSLERYSHWRAHSVETVVAMLSQIRKETNCDGVGFWDDYFWKDARRAQAIQEWLASQGMGYLCEARAQMLSDRFTARLAATGCLQVFVGAESGSDALLQRIAKQARADDFRRAAEVTARHQVNLRLSFIYGFPDETDDEASQTAALIEELLQWPHVSISGPKRFTPYPGTPLFAQACVRGFHPPRTTREWSRIHRNLSDDVFPLSLSREVVARLESLQERRRGQGG